MDLFVNFSAVVAIQLLALVLFLSGWAIVVCAISALIEQDEEEE